jgi:hypothetical protein
MFSELPRPPTAAYATTFSRTDRVRAGKRPGPYLTPPGQED